MERLLDAEDAVLSIAKFLSAKDCLSLHTVSRKIHGILGKHDDALFGYHLRRDFSEGEVLLYVANKKNLSHKKLYRAFLGRWSLPKQADEKIRAASEVYYEDEGDRHTKIMINDWVKPPHIPVDQYQGAKLLIPNDDVDNLVFIVRVGSGEDDFCALMEWNPKHHPKKRRSQLIIDQSWIDDNGVKPNDIPQDRETIACWYDQDLDVDELTEAMKSKHPLTFHAVDTRHCQVASLMDNTPLEQLRYDENDGISNFRSDYGFGLPSLWGVTPEFSPYHRKLTKQDFQYFLSPHCREYDDEVPPLEYLPITGKIQLNYCCKMDWMGECNEPTNDIVLSHPQRGINFTFCGDSGESSVRKPHQICNFLRTLMKEKCIEVEPREIPKFAAVTHQPEWVKTNKILDAITSYASFEDQAGMLRLVCRQFDASALRQIEAKLDKTKVIGLRIDCGEGGGYNGIGFKATVRRGWSDTCLTSKESAIDDALWLASCRCCFEYCADKNSCKNASKPLTCYGYNSDTKKEEKPAVDGKENNSPPVEMETKKKASAVAAGKKKNYDSDSDVVESNDSDEYDSDENDIFGGNKYVKTQIIIDEATVRQKLADKGWVHLTELSPRDSLAFERSDYWERPNKVECSFKEDEMTLFELCKLASEVIDSNTGGEYMYEEMGRRVPLDGELKRDYGVSKAITSRQFVRSIFLVFVRAAASVKALDKNESAIKKARIAPSRKVTIGTAKSSVQVEDEYGRYSRMKKIMRFYSANNEPMEICFESRSSYTRELCEACRLSLPPRSKYFSTGMSCSSYQNYKLHNPTQHSNQ